jgi:hypothetical protein
VKSKKHPFGLEPKKDKSILPPAPKAIAANKPDWIGLIEKKDAEAVKKAMQHDKAMKAVHDKLLGATGLHSRPNKK